MDYRFLLNHYLKRRKTDGFTLIELLVVIIILGILAAIAAPELLKQVEKGRQTEATASLGTINRAQQGYRFENATFAPLAALPVKLGEGKYYDIDNDTASYATPDAFGSAQKAEAKNTYDNDIRNYASAVGQTAGGVFEAIICAATSPNDDATAATGNNGTGDVSCMGGVALGGGGP